MRGLRRFLPAMALLACPAFALAAGVGYQFDVTTAYGAGTAPGAIGLGGSPDTGFLIVTNNGASTFTGVLSLTGTAASSQVISLATPGAFVFAPGASVTFSAGPESSNQGGWNKVGGGSPDNGLLFSMVGTVALGVSSEGVGLSVADKDIHSGVPRLANGTLSDSYVLQGGDPFGGDTGDAFEETQADGHFQFLEVAAVPLPGAVWSGLALMGLVVLARVGRARRA